MFFPTVQSLDSHNLAKHKVSTASFRNRKLMPDRRVFSCEFCPRSFVIARLCWRHAQKEHGDVISQLWLKCDACNLHFPNSDVLAIHTTTKHNRKKGWLKIFKGWTFRLDDKWKSVVEYRFTNCHTNLYK